jgi:glutamine amidotransferase
MTLYICHVPFCNIGSLVRALEKSFTPLGDIHLTHEVEIQNTNSLYFFPGVSTFDGYIKNLTCSSDKLEFVRKKNKIIGICAGAQVFFESSEEGNERGLGLLPGRVKKIATSSNIKVPHLGWNKIVLNENHPMAHLFDGIDLTNKKFYFSHSYRFPDSEHALAYVDYGERFPIVVAKDNLIAIQFHPEKSYGQGLQLLKNICELS